jgi:hypothetical protein
MHGLKQSFKHEYPFRLSETFRNVLVTMQASYPTRYNACPDSSGESLQRSEAASHRIGFDSQSVHEAKERR